MKFESAPYQRWSLWAIADEVGSLALTVFVDVQSVLPKFKKLVGIPSRLQVDGAIRNAAAGRAVQRLSTPPFQSWHMPW